jgi:rRNA-processing protein FCF1
MATGDPSTQLRVVIDTNTIWSDLRLSRLAMRALLELSLSGAIALIVPEVVIQEVSLGRRRRRVPRWPIRAGSEC